MGTRISVNRKIKQNFQAAANPILGSWSPCFYSCPVCTLWPEQRVRTVGRTASSFCAWHLHLHKTAWPRQTRHDTSTWQSTFASKWKNTYWSHNENTWRGTSWEALRLRGTTHTDVCVCTYTLSHTNAWQSNVYSCIPTRRTGPDDIPKPGQPGGPVEQDADKEEQEDHKDLVKHIFLDPKSEILHFCF